MDFSSESSHPASHGRNERLTSESDRSSYRQGLRIANPTIMIKAVVNIVLGQPMGQASLFQRYRDLPTGPVSNVCRSLN